MHFQAASTNLYDMRKGAKTAIVVRTPNVAARSTARPIEDSLLKSLNYAHD